MGSHGGIPLNRGFLARWSLAVSGSQRRRAFLNEMWVGRVALGATLISLVGFAVDTTVRLHDLGALGAWRTFADIVLGRALTAFFLFSALVYQLMRQGYLARFAAHPAPERDPWPPAPDDAPRLAILVPSYMEEPRVIRRTLLAAALQQSPNRRVVLLIDDPPLPRAPGDASRLAAARALPGEINALLAPPCRRFEQALADFLERPLPGAAEVERLTAHWRHAATFLESLASDVEVRDHNDALFVEQILLASARAHRSRAAALEAAPVPGPSELLRAYRHLAALFSVEAVGFERKRYANLSHEPNKAMNLNAYLALMGRSFREAVSPQGCLLVASDPEGASLRVPGADFVIVLDADSVILSEYSLRLMRFMAWRRNRRVAVVQTPYASVPHAGSAVERIAGATTDVQLLTHQGATRFGAGSWVGASALVRMDALDEIVSRDTERGHPISIYVRDRTLTEDTDTTVALVRKGWRVVNYPDRLAYSATPQDFGALLIQRRRWATGGLIILADVMRYCLERPIPARLLESLIRAQYILAAPLGSIALVVLLFYPFAPGTAWTPWTLPALAAYFVSYGRDLMHNGRGSVDLLRALALNSMLLPINLAGALNSIGQLCTGRKVPFERTPKVEGRTTAPPRHIAAQLGFLALTAAQVPARLTAGDWPASVFLAMNAAGFAYGLHTFIGWESAFGDLYLGLGERPRESLEHLRQFLTETGRRLLGGG
jgi:cellulose synthase/poly-beta-1,6-N-acetylglucosamine synthase-like glycosyltransferase